jgi:hypothetical protein
MGDNGHYAACAAVPPPDRSPCPYRPQPGSDRCWYHSRAVTTLDTSRWCTWVGSRGRQCYAYVLPGRLVCSRHRREPGLPPAELLARRQVLGAIGTNGAACTAMLTALVAGREASWRRLKHLPIDDGAGYRITEQCSYGKLLEGMVTPGGASEPATAQAYPGGGAKAWNSRSSNRAKWIVVRSPYCGPTICTPTGSPSGVNPQGATVDGR